MGAVSTKMVIKGFQNSEEEILIRSDLRDYNDIFEFGLRPRNVTFKQYIRNRKKIIEPTLRKNIIRLGEQPFDFDFDPNTAICVSKNIDAAMLFPVPESGSYHFRTWMYFIRSKFSYPTYVHQIHPDAKNFVQEMACRDVPSGDILAAIQCERYFDRQEKNLYYRFVSDLKWNPKSIEINISKTTQKFQDRIRQLVEERVNRLIKSYGSDNYIRFEESIDKIIENNDVCSLGNWLSHLIEGIDKEEYLTPYLIKTVTENKFTLAKLLLWNGAAISVLSDQNLEALCFAKQELAELQKRKRTFKDKVAAMQSFKPRTLIFNHFFNLHHQQKNTNAEPVINEQNNRRQTRIPDIFFTENIKVSKQEMVDSAFGRGSNTAKRLKG